MCLRNETTRGSHLATHDLCYTKALLPRLLLHGHLSSEKYHFSQRLISPSLVQSYIGHSTWKRNRPARGKKVLSVHRLLHWKHLQDEKEKRERRRREDKSSSAESKSHTDIRRQDCHTLFSLYKEAKSPEITHPKSPHPSSSSLSLVYPPSFLPCSS